MSKRNCLKCQNEFHSLGIHNRLCHPCTEEIKKYGKEFFEYPFYKGLLNGKQLVDLTVPTAVRLYL